MKDKLIIIKDADPEMEGKLKALQVKVESLEMEKREIENKGDLNLEKLKKVEQMLELKTFEMQQRETNLQKDWESLVKEHNLGVKELEKKKEYLKVEAQSIMFQKLDIKRQTEICQAKDKEIIKSQDLIK